MLKKLTAGVAALAFVGMAAPAMADSGIITVTVTVGSIVDLTIVDNTAGLSTDITTAADNTATTAAEFGEFKVQANRGYSLEVAPTATWDANGLDNTLGTLVKFTGVTRTTEYMGGELFIKSGTTTTNWTRSGAGAGKVNLTGQTAGTKTWTLGAVFQPQYAGDTGGTLKDGGTGSPNFIAPQQDYTTTATVTVTAS